MTRAERNLILIGNVAVIGSGLFYGVVKYFFKTQTEWGIAPHAVQPWGLYLHILVSPILIFAVGMIWQEHIWKKIKSKHQEMRGSGITLSWQFFLMCWSGYMLQVSVNQSFKQAMLILHLATSGVWTISFIYHFVTGRQRHSVIGVPRIQRPWPRGRILGFRRRPDKS